jgi:hypothetical protein
MTPDERHRLIREEDLRLGVAERPIIEDLRSVGVEVESVWDLVNSPNNYNQAIPVLLRHLELPYPVKIRGGIARSLGIRGATFLWPRLLELYRKEPIPLETPGMGAKDGLAVALSAIATTENIPDIIELLRDRRHGSSRVLLLVPLRRRRKKDPAIAAVLKELSTDPQFQKEISAWK